jgi:hypothetical protein
MAKKTDSQPTSQHAGIVSQTYAGEKPCLATHFRRSAAANPSKKWPGGTQSS